MKRNAADILKEAMELAPEARAALAGSLIESLDRSLDEEAESAWAAEIESRLADLDQGKVQPVPWSEARRRIAGR